MEFSDHISGTEIYRSRSGQETLQFVTLLSTSFTATIQYTYVDPVFSNLLPSTAVLGRLTELYMWIVVSCEYQARL